MRIFFIVLFLFQTLTVIAQADSSSLKEAMARLDKAMIAKDTSVLNQLLHKDLTFGHSNAWVQTRQDLKNDLQSGKLVYNNLENTSAIIAAINKNWATVRTNTIAEGSLNQNPFKSILHILQVWIKTKEGWKLIARQSVKLN